MNSVFLVSLVGEGVHAGSSILGFIDCNDRDFLARHIKNKYNLTLGEQYQPRFTFEIGCHWEYATNRPDVDVHIDIVSNLKE